MLLESGILGADQPWWVVYFAFLIGHAIADYPLQGEFLATAKNHRLPPEQTPRGFENTRGLWFHCLTAHALIHAGFVWAISGLFVLGLVEFVLHWVVDFSKSAGLTNFHVDQFLHIAAKGAYVAAIYYQIV